jgi:hypothetical protein
MSCGRMLSCIQCLTRCHLPASPAYAHRQDGTQIRLVKILNNVLGRGRHDKNPVVQSHLVPFFPPIAISIAVRIIIQEDRMSFSTFGGGAVTLLLSSETCFVFSPIEVVAVEYTSDPAMVILESVAIVFPFTLKVTRCLFLPTVDEEDASECPL